MNLCRMLNSCKLIFGIVIDLFWPHTAMDAEILMLRWQKTPFMRDDDLGIGDKRFKHRRTNLPLIRMATFALQDRNGDAVPEVGGR